MTRRLTVLKALDAYRDAVIACAEVRSCADGLVSLRLASNLDQTHEGVRSIVPSLRRLIESADEQALALRRELIKTMWPDAPDDEIREWSSECPKCEETAWVGIGLVTIDDEIECRSCKARLRWYVVNCLGPEEIAGLREVPE